jgi:hypothetical protein
MKINIGKLLTAAFKAVKSNPAIVISAVTAIAPVVKAVKAEIKKPKVG